VDECGFYALGMFDGWYYRAMNRVTQWMKGAGIGREGGVRHETAAPAVELEQVTASYGGGSNRSGGRANAVEEISFQISAGERIAVVGPNGAGKSTLFRLMVGTLKPDKGEVRVAGYAPGSHICIAYVPQRSQIDWSFPVTVEDVVMMGRVGRIGLFRHPQRRDWEIGLASLERVGATVLAGKQIGELSGGQQQRVFLARALAQEAEILLLDEPMSGLDIPSQEAIFTILDGLRQDGVTVVMATHDLNLAAERFDRIMLLNGRLISFGRPEVVLQTEHLLRAYGGHVHIVSGGEETVLLTDSCCECEG
jgi:ABC-type Mn2+/Zn2+ transport system ATPase subunit